MLITSVRALKAEVLEKVISPLVELQKESHVYSATEAERLNNNLEPSSISMGIAGGARGDFRLAIRIYDRLAVESQALHHIRQLALGEVEVRYIGEINVHHRPWHRHTHRPCLIGSSVGHFKVGAGTIGAFPLHIASGSRVMLSNNHVLANSDAASVGDPILQAAALDSGSVLISRCGELLDAVKLKTNSPNTVDAAIASLDMKVTADKTVLKGWGKLKGLRPDPIGIGDKVYKIGRTTGLTRGKVTAIEFDNLRIKYPSLGTLLFEQQTEIEGIGAESFSSAGDSGSLIFDENGFAFGLLFAGSTVGGSNSKGFTYANSLVSVLTELHLSLDT